MYRYLLEKPVKGFFSIAQFQNGIKLKRLTYVYCCKNLLYFESVFNIFYVTSYSKDEGKLLAIRNNIATANLHVLV